METGQKETQPLIDTNARLSLDDSFRFDCGPHVRCFTECCGKLQLVLTPYDVLRLRKRLDLAPDQLLDEYTILRRRTPHGFPEVMLRMDPDSGKRCPFVTEAGCSVYEDRPGACRIYPIGRASTKHPILGTHEEFYFTVKEDHCRGFEQQREWTVREWIVDQGVEEYNRLNDLLMELYVLRSRRQRAELTPQHVQMFMMALYNGERFREFVLKSGFLRRFDVAPDLVERLASDDVELLEFAFRWLRFALFQEPTLTIREPVKNL